jgi:hypothetical protein
MARSVKGIDELRAKLQKLKNIDNDEIVMAVAKHGAALLEKELGTPNITVKPEPLGNGKARIIASGSQISFIEFGTGVRGKGTYKGELPTEDISFESRGREWTTEGWVYNYYATYMSPPSAWGKPKNVKDFQGFEAKAPVWKTATKLANEEAANAIKNYLKEKGV